VKDIMARVLNGCVADYIIQCSSAYSACCTVGIALPLSEVRILALLSDYNEISEQIGREDDLRNKNAISCTCYQIELTSHTERKHQVLT